MRAISPMMLDGTPHSRPPRPLPLLPNPQRGASVHLYTSVADVRAELVRNVNDSIQQVDLFPKVGEPSWCGGQATVLQGAAGNITALPAPIPLLVALRPPCPLGSRLVANSWMRTLLSAPQGRQFLHDDEYLAVLKVGAPCGCGSRAYNCLLAQGPGRPWRTCGAVQRPSHAAVSCGSAPAEQTHRPSFRPAGPAELVQHPGRHGADGMGAVP